MSRTYHDRNGSLRARNPKRCKGCKQPFSKPHAPDCQVKH